MKTLIKIVAFYGIGIISVALIVLFIAVYNLICYDFLFIPNPTDILNVLTFGSVLLGFSALLIHESYKTKNS